MSDFDLRQEYIELHGKCIECDHFVLAEKCLDKIARIDGYFENSVTEVASEENK